VNGGRGEVERMSRLAERSYHSQSLTLSGKALFCASSSVSAHPGNESPSVRMHRSYMQVGKKIVVKSARIVFAIRAIPLAGGDVGTGWNTGNIILVRRGLIQGSTARDCF
jgi:hypothetical protein